MVHDEAKRIVGVDGCKAGWIAVSHQAGGLNGPDVHIFKTFLEICQHMPRGSLIGVDMPIGLPDQAGAGGRAPDRAARLVLGPRRSSVFAVPSRAAVYAFERGYAEVRSIARETSSPAWAPSKQAFWLFPRIQQVDLALRADAELASQVFEIHPEVAFRLMNGAPLETPKKKRGRCNPEGMEQRKSLLRQQGFTSAFLDRTPPRGAGLDDLLDACAVAWSTARILAGEALVFPDQPARDEMGLRVAIWA